MWRGPDNIAVAYVWIYKGYTGYVLILEAKGT